MPDFAFRDVPLVCFERDDDGNIKFYDELKPTVHMFCKRRVKIDDGLPKFDGYPTGMSM